MNKIISVLVAVIFSGAGIALFVSHLEEKLNASSASISEVERYADAEFHNALIRVTDSGGIQRYLTQANRVIHYTDETSEVVGASLLVNQDKGSPLLLVSDRVTLLNNNKQAILHGSVRVDREASDDNPAAHITSRDVSIDYEKKYAHSDAFTTIESDSQVTSGTGIDIWFDGPTRIRLLSNARSRYTP
ncbi:LPS export ABC transporter periplasmic protein LptC [Solemya velum gill symbiont]|uniref:LPS export ABC transporter periplasmic protein LptC n=2 Tax=Solemya velum gill symbiont TaxID=2340 RepID=UPI0009974C2A|nr:LPS export ABC transporter periplasmic protein LptC [Solemya velum gill symbiont]OOY98423.1 LPS export ABC transporter periplasmic protein LptC [Solemya velum gill symbiont]OOZ00733.1 LPS export ABC transporter periplasmic protein LptC [Solemya velum gill symbiont]OOZ02906.1 LPS export ABC transporter periplasmic protein LptC [Solemya velum gill symbiont]OOZ05155.1 LPS export ABC transporter periplasmic protein LptC [Solemya velum gill symbiont]OOZ07394.1 LPS export ABC transporter periplas